MWKLSYIYLTVVSFPYAYRESQCSKDNFWGKVAPTWTFHHYVKNTKICHRQCWGCWGSNCIWLDILEVEHINLQFKFLMAFPAKCLLCLVGFVSCFMYFLHYEECFLTDNPTFLWFPRRHSVAGSFEPSAKVLTCLILWVTHISSLILQSLLILILFSLNKK